MPSEGFEPATPATKRSQTYALDRAATGIGKYFVIRQLKAVYPKTLVTDNVIGKRSSFNYIEFKFLFQKQKWLMTKFGKIKWDIISYVETLY
jgi:hypothetical protein